MVCRRRFTIDKSGTNNHSSTNTTQHHAAPVSKAPLVTPVSSGNGTATYKVDIAAYAVTVVTTTGFGALFLVLLTGAFVATGGVVLFVVTCGGAVRFVVAFGAGVVSFLAGPAGRWVNGQVVYANGGFV